MREEQQLVYGYCSSVIVGGFEQVFIHKDIVNNKIMCQSNKSFVNHIRRKVYRENFCPYFILALNSLN